MKIFKKLTAVIISLVTVFAMFPAVNITASAYSYTGLDEIGGKVLIESSKKPSCQQWQWRSLGRIQV